MPKDTLRKKKKEKRMYYPGVYPYKAEIILGKITEKPFLSTNDYADMLSKSEKNKYPHSRILKVFKKFQELEYVSELRIISGPEHEDCPFRSKQYLYELEKEDWVLDVIKKNTNVEKDAKKYGDKVSYSMICKHCKKFVQVKLKGNSKIHTARCWNPTFNGNLVLLTFIDDNKKWEIIQNSDNKILHLAKLLMENQKNEFVDLLIKRLSKIVKDEPDLIPIAESWYKEMNTKMLKWKINKENCPELHKYQIKLESELQTETILDARHRKFVSKFR